VLLRAFPGSVVHTAKSTEDALMRIAYAEKCGFSYGIVILDFKLPETAQSRVAKLDLKTRQAVRDSPATHGAAIFSISAYLAEPEIQRWIQDEKRQNPLMIEPISVEKGSDWVDQLVEKIRQVVYETRVEQRLNLLFGSGTAPSAQVNRAHALHSRGGAATAYSATQEINALAQDIEEHWSYLSPGLRGRVRRIFPLEERTEGGRTSRASSRSRN
jgi:hypothetical protein